MWITLRKQKPIGSSMSFFISLCFHVLIQNLLSDHRPDSAAEDIFVSHTVGPSLASCKLQITPLQVNTHGHPKPCPIVGKTQKILEDSQTTIDVQKCTQSNNGSGSSHSPMATPIKDIHQALIAQHEPLPDDINGLHMWSLISETHSFSHLTVISLYSFISNPVLVVSLQTIGITYLSQKCHWLWFQDWMQEVQAQNGFIIYNTSQKQQYGVFKSTQEGQIDLMGAVCPFSATSSKGAMSIALNSLIFSITVALICHHPWFQHLHSPLTNKSRTWQPTLCLSNGQVHCFKACTLLLLHVMRTSAVCVCTQFHSSDVSWWVWWLLTYLVWHWRKRRSSLWRNSFGQQMVHRGSISTTIPSAHTSFMIMWIVNVLSF